MKVLRLFAALSLALSFNVLLATSSEATPAPGLNIEAYTFSPAYHYPSTTTGLTPCNLGISTVANINANWGGGGPGGNCPADYFIIHYTGFITYPTSTTVQFQNISDDGFKLFINNAPVIQDWNLHGCGGATGTFTFEANVSYPIEAWMYEYGGGACSILNWRENATGSFSVVPASAFSLTAVEPPPVINPPTNLTGTVGDGNISLTWVAPTSGVAVERYAVSWSTSNFTTNGWGVASTTNSITLSNELFTTSGGLGVPYQFKIRSDNDSLGMYSSYSNIVELTPTAPTPNPVTPPSDGNTSGSSGSTGSEGSSNPTTPSEGGTSDASNPPPASGSTEQSSGSSGSSDTSSTTTPTDQGTSTEQSQPQQGSSNQGTSTTPSNETSQPPAETVQPPAPPVVPVVYEPPAPVVPVQPPSTPTPTPIEQTPVPPPKEEVPQEETSTPPTPDEPETSDETAPAEEIPQEPTPTPDTNEEVQPEQPEQTSEPDVTLPEDDTSVDVVVPDDTNAGPVTNQDESSIEPPKDESSDSITEEVQAKYEKLGLEPNSPDQLPEDEPKLPDPEQLKPRVQVDKPGVENGGIEFFGTKSQPQVIGEDGQLTPPPPPPGSGLPIPPDAVTTEDTFIGQPGGTTFNAPDVAVPMELVPVDVPAALEAIPGAGEAVQALNEAYVAMANIGNDMSPITRKKAKKILLATIVVGQIAQLRRLF